MCVRKNPKGLPIKYFCLFYWLGAGGGRDAQQVGACPGTPTSVFYAYLGRLTSDPSRGRGAGRHTLTPSPQAAITTKIAHRVPAHKIFQYWPRFPSHGPPMHASHPPPTFFAALHQCVYVKSITKYATDHAHRIYFSSQSSIHIVCTVCMSVCLEFSTADLANHQIGAHIYYLKWPLHQKETSSHITNDSRKYYIST